MNVLVGVDDSVVIRDNAGVIEISQNGGAFAACASGDSLSATVDYIQVTGTNAGNEKFTMFNPPDFADENTSVDLGNGTDSLTWEYGALASPATADPVVAAAVARIGDAADGTGTGDFNNDAFADLRVINAELQTLNGDSGVSNDVLNAGPANGDYIGFDFASVAGTADATLTVVGPYSQNLTLNGGQGDDDLTSGFGNDTFIGGAGSDEVIYTSATGGVTVDLQAGTASGMGNDTLTDVQDVEGSDFDDVITGNTLDNDLQGNDGNDVINGAAGDDDINGDDDDDTLTGGLGDDEIDGDDDDDVINEEAAANGSDDLDGDSGIDVINYGARTTNTVLVEGGGFVSGQDANNDGDASDAADERDLLIDFEIFVSGSGNDTHVGNGDNETFVPGAGDDDVDGNGGGADLLDISAAATATINLETGTATGEGNDTFEDVEQFATGAGNDVVIPDIQDGLPALFDWFADGGIDTIDGSTNTGGFAVDLSVLGDTPTGCAGTPPPVGSAGAGICTEVEDATGGSGNDSLIGNPINNVLLGNAGFDTLAGDAANDFIEGGAGNDSLAGGSGADFLSYVNAPSGVIVDMQLGFASGGDGDDAIGFFEIVLGSDFADEITGGQTFLDANLRVRGRGGDDLITGTNSSDTLAGGGGNDGVRAGGGDDIVRLGAGNDIGTGGSGDDVIRGAGGNDQLLGGSGDDFLFGGRGSDTGNGGTGDDTCRTEVRRSC
jgi:Ca2+-binding RTX toxin-like protein